MWPSNLSSNQIAKFLNEKGLDAALAHPINSQAIGKNLFEVKDTTGKLFVQEYIKVAKSKGEGWTEYMYPTPEELKKPTPYNEKKSSKKISFVYRVPGKDPMVIAGFFE